MFKRYFAYAAMGIATLASTPTAQAQVAGGKAIRVAVGYGAGGSTDVIARILGQKVSETLGQSVIIENKAGATGSIAADLVAKAEPDGSRLLLLGSGTFAYSVLSKNVPYNVLSDFTPIAYVAFIPLVLVVNPTLPARTVDELVQYARSKPGELNYGSEGIGGTSHLAAALFGQVTNTQLVHVPFKGAMESTTATAGGQVELNFPSLTTALPFIRAGKLHPIAVSSLQRSALYPSTPTLDEMGMKDFEQVAWFGFVGPANMPKDVVEKLRSAIVSSANTPKIKESLSKLGVEIQIRSPAQFTTFMRDSADQITKLAKDANIKIE